ncbi:MAG: hypothetical protein V3581_02955 [Candidatus Cardinium sp.]|uniref:hypothetical protein n=1 Tax=Candidatus Cardinium sp. TP TaxID=2961955 RepID=UPI0021B0147B|nr:hypothetical protein [Candidatus Cardinium sp. TP]MCT4697378.1 hypothetical protein [Candidatus Cardinium sp. TP]MDN5247298.1 hypothetical protein [Candidatus Cardinium sp.]
MCQLFIGAHERFKWAQWKQTPIKMIGICFSHCFFALKEKRPCKKSWCRKWHHADD